MERYIAYRFHWTEFTKLSNRERISALLTQHAEYKIHLREMTVARYILFEAIELDAKNTKARELLQVRNNSSHFFYSNKQLMKNILPTISRLYS